VKEKTTTPSSAFWELWDGNHYLCFEFTCIVRFWCWLWQSMGPAQRKNVMRSGFKVSCGPSPNDPSIWCVQIDFTVLCRRKWVSMRHSSRVDCGEWAVKARLSRWVTSHCLRGEESTRYEILCLCGEGSLSPSQNLENPPPI